MFQPPSALYEMKSSDFTVEGKLVLTYSSGDTQVLVMNDANVM
jgi:hypothetical protein